MSAEVRPQDGETLRGFDVVAESLPTERCSATELGRDVAKVVHRELAFGQLAATDDQGAFKRTVV